MRICLIGSGNLATSLGLALHEAGHQVLQVYSPTLQHANDLALKVQSESSQKVEAIDNVEQLTGDAQVYIFSVKDAVLEQLIAKAAPHVQHGLCVHTAGSVGMDVFRPWVTHYGVLYPMQTFSKTRPVDFDDLPCFIEAHDKDALATLLQLAQSVSRSVTVLDSENRRKLHLAAVFACNFANHCYAIAHELVTGAGLDWSCMLPLINETAAKVNEISPLQAQTGPAVRYDKNIIERQKAQLHDHELWQEIYDAMSKSIHKLSMQNDK